MFCYSIEIIINHNYAKQLAFKKNIFSETVTTEILYKTKVIFKMYNE